ncbi:MAG: CoA transferase, partial [Thiolinea sp.]
HIDVAMLGATLAIAALQTSEYFGTGNDPKKLGSAHPRNAPYQAFQAQDGYFGMAAGNNNLWHLVCDVVECDELKADERFLNPTLRAQNQLELKNMLEAIFTQQSVAHWLEAFNAVGVPCSPINTYSQALADPQVEYMGWVQDLTLANGVATKTFASPLRINNETKPLRMRPPELGEHTDEVLAELGLAANKPDMADPQDSSSVLLVEQQEDILTLTLNRPDSANALNPELVEALLEQITQAQGVRLCVIRANGRNFCAGFDLSELEALSDGDLLLRFLRVETLLQAVHHAPFPVVALAQGHAMGAGADLFAACWQRIASPNTKFRMPGWQFELALGTRRLTRLIGSDAARDMLIDSKTVLAEAGLASGLVSEVVEADGWEAKVAALAQRARSLPDNALQQMLALTIDDSRSDDMAAIVATAGQPGLKRRILDYKVRLKTPKPLSLIGRGAKE